MKGKLLSIDEILKLDHGTKVWLESQHINGEISLINRDIDAITCKDAIEHVHYYFDSLTSGNYHIHVYEWIGKPRVYYGDEILKMIREGKLKEGQKLVSDRGINHIVKKDSEGDLYFDYDNMSRQLNSAALQYRTFTIIEKEYMTFLDAVKTGKKIKYKNWDKYYSLIESIKKVSWKSDTRIDEMLKEKAWEVEEC